MGTLITTEVAVAHAHCPRKAFLLLNTAGPPQPRDYESLCRARGEAHRERHLARLRRDGHDVVGYGQHRLGAGHSYLVGVDLRVGDLSAPCDVLVRADPPPCPTASAYFPQMFAGTYSVTD